MGCAQSKETTPAGKLSLPQSLSEAERKERSDALAKLRDTYAFADDPGMPPHPVLNKLNFPHELNKDERFAGGLAKKLGVFTKIIFLNIFEQSEVVCKEIADEAAQVAHHFKDHWAQLGKAETPPSHDHGPQDGRDALYKQFSVMFKKDFLDKQLPFNGVLTDEAFGVRVKTASAPYQLKRVDAIPEYVHITEEDVKGVLPEGDTLASLIAEKRLFKLDYQYLSKVKIWEQEKYQKMGWVVNPICFLYLTKDRELLLPCAVQLYPDPHTAANPVFTPKDPPGLWLAAKMFVINCSNNTHLCETHFMSGLTWVGLGMSLRRQVSRSHPISAFLEPFMYLFLGMWGGNRPPEDDIKTPVIRELWSQWNYQNVVTPNQLKHQGIDDAATLPHFYWRDDVQDMWATFHTLVSNMVNKVYASDDDIKADYEMQNFAKELVDPAICGYKGLEFDGAAKPITKAHLIELLTQCITGWTCRYQYDTFAWPWYVWIPFTPLSFTLPPPTTKDDISLETIRDHLIKPSSFEAGLQRTAIKIVTNAQVSKLTNGDAGNPQHVPPFPGYMEGWPGGKEIVADYMKALNELEIKMKNRDAKVQTQAHNNIVFSMRPSIVQGSNAAI